jgi:deazaflavin-dependent oxidoreductase (nitroreductase family)
MTNQKLFMKFGNGMMKTLLRSPFHKMISGNMMLVTVKGRKSGKPYTIPVNYVLDGDDVYVNSQRDRTWWRNLRGGAEAILRLRGRDFQAAGDVVEEEQGVTAQLAIYLVKAPQYARYFGVSLSPEGNINLQETARAAKSRVCILFKIKG